MQLLIIIAGLALVFMTEYDTFGWIVFGIGLLTIVLPLLFVGAVFRKMNRL